MPQGAAYRGIRQACGDAAVQRSRAVQQIGTHPAADGDAIAVHAHQFEAKQMIEGMPGEEIQRLSRGICDLPNWVGSSLMILALSRQKEK